MIAKAVENPAVYIPNRRFQTADCRSALAGFGKYVDAEEKVGSGTRPEADLSGRGNASYVQFPRRRKLRT